MWKDRKILLINVEQKKADDRMYKKNHRSNRKIIKGRFREDTNLKCLCWKEILCCVNILTLCRAMVIRNNMSNPMMMASTMIQEATVASGTFPTNIVCTSTWSGLSVNEKGKFLRIQDLWIYNNTKNNGHKSLENYEKPSYFNLF